MKPNCNTRFFLKKRALSELRGHRPDEQAAIAEFVAKRGVTKVAAGSSLFAQSPSILPHAGHQFGYADVNNTGGRVLGFRGAL